MMHGSSLFVLLVNLVMLIGGSAMVFQGYPHWQKFRDTDSLYWWLLGAFAIALGAWEIITRLLLPSTLDASTAELLALSRRILDAFGLLFVAFVVFRQYIWQR